MCGSVARFRLESGDRLVLLNAGLNSNPGPGMPPMGVGLTGFSSSLYASVGSLHTVSGQYTCLEHGLGHLCVD